MIKFLTSPVKIFVSLALVLNLFMLIPASVDACSGSSTFNCVCTDNNLTAGKGLAGSNSLCKDQSTINPVLGADGVIAKVTNIIAIVAGIAAVIMIIISGLLFVTAGGDPQRVATARNTIIYTLIGIVVIVMAKFIIVFIVSRFA